MRFIFYVLFFTLISITTFYPSSFAIKIPHIIVSVPAQKYFVERIGKGMFNVISLITPQMDPHTFEPSPALLMECAKADVYFTLGVSFETMWLERIKSVNPSIRIIPLLPPTSQEFLADINKEAEPTSNAEITHTPHANPHVWLSPALMLQMLPTITEAMSAELPHQSKKFYSENELLIREIEEFQWKFREKVQNIPQKNRIFLSYHPTWELFSKEFNITELDIEVNGKEPSPKQLKEVLDSAKLNGITTIFIDNKGFERRVTTIANMLHAQLEIVDPLQEDWFLLMDTLSTKLIESFP